MVLKNPSLYHFQKQTFEASLSWLVEMLHQPIGLGLMRASLYSFHMQPLGNKIRPLISEYFSHYSNLYEHFVQFSFNSLWINYFLVVLLQGI